MLEHTSRVASLVAACILATGCDAAGSADAGADDRADVGTRVDAGWDGAAALDAAPPPHDGGTQAAADAASPLGECEPDRIDGRVRVVDPSHPSASDDNDGSSDAPWASLEHACARSLPATRCWWRPVATAT